MTPYANTDNHNSFTLPLNEPFDFSTLPFTLDSLCQQFNNTSDDIPTSTYLPTTTPASLNPPLDVPHPGFVDLTHSNDTTPPQPPRLANHKSPHPSYYATPMTRHTFAGTVEGYLLAA